MANYDAIKKQTDEQAKKKIEEANKIYNDQMAATEQIYNEQIAESDKSFELTYDQANVQKRVNERFAQEAVANMGLTNSGYNRNQQAQIRLAYGNAVLKTDLQKTAAANSIRQQLASYKADIEAQKAQNAFSIQNSYDQLAQETYNTQVAAEKAAAAKAAAAKNQAYSSLISVLNSDESTDTEKAQAIYSYCSTNNISPEGFLNTINMSVDKYMSLIYGIDSSGNNSKSSFKSALNGARNGIIALTDTGTLVPGRNGFMITYKNGNSRPATQAEIKAGKSLDTPFQKPAAQPAAQPTTQKNGSDVDMMYYWDSFK